MELTDARAGIQMFRSAALDDVLPIARGNEIAVIGERLNEVALAMARYYRVLTAADLDAGLRSIEAPGRPAGPEESARQLSAVILEGGNGEALRAARRWLAANGVVCLLAPNAIRQRRVKPPGLNSSKTYFGYRALFWRAGYRVKAEFVCTSASAYPTEMWPLTTPALVFLARQRHLASGRTFGVRWIVKRMLTLPAAWRLLGREFVFILEPQRA